MNLTSLSNHITEKICAVLMLLHTIKDLSRHCGVERTATRHGTVLLLVRKHLAMSSVLQQACANNGQRRQIVQCPTFKTYQMLSDIVFDFLTFPDDERLGVPKRGFYYTVAAQTKRPHSRLELN